MPSIRVWSLAGAAGVVVFVWSMLAAGITYDERQARIGTVTEGLARAPGDIEAWNRLASLIVGAEDRDEAFQRWRTRAPKALLEQHAGQAMLLYRMGSRLSGEAETQAYAQTIEQLEAFTSEHPQLARAHHWHTLTHAYRQTEQPEKALAAAERTEELAAPLVRDDPSPQLATVLYWLGSTRHELGDAEGGRRGWALLVKLMDQTGELRELGRQFDWESMSQIALRAGDMETAAECLARYEAKLERASEVRAMPDRWHELGWRWRQAGQETEAKRVWTTLAGLQQAQIEADPKNANARYNLACYRALAGDATGALQAWRDTLALGWMNPAYADNDQDLDAIRKTPQFAQSMVELTERALESGGTPEDAPALLYLKARYQTIAGDADGAVATLHRAVDEGFLDFPRLRDDPMLAPLEAEPGFAALRERIEARFRDWRDRRRQRHDRASQEGEPA